VRHPEDLLVVRVRKPRYSNPSDKQQMVSHPDCAVIESATLDRMPGSPYEVVTVQPLTYDDRIPVSEADAESSRSPTCPAGF